MPRLQAGVLFFASALGNTGRYNLHSMWDEQDYFSRWVQGISAIVLGMCAVAGIYLATQVTVGTLRIGAIVATLGCIRVSWRCAYYAITGSNNIYRDTF